MVDFGERGEHMTTGGWIFMALGMLVLIVLVVALVLWLLSQQRRQDAATPPPTVSAREALDHRLVDGAITTEQYDEIRAKLEGGAGRANTS
ncbi:MAG TPA: hypothetical protein VN618_02855 [Solirubrobacteraceae bacterium]|nr:hypothetical protein [Solirubrobacteraceae bacterium]